MRRPNQWTLADHVCHKSQFLASMSHELRTPLKLNPEPVNLERLIDEVIGTAGQLAEKNKNRLIVEAQENVGTSETRCSSVARITTSTR
jgi:K+-sensing histidine kinase KdpD